MADVPLEVAKSVHGSICGPVCVRAVRIITEPVSLFSDGHHLTLQATRSNYLPCMLCRSRLAYGCIYVKQCFFITSNLPINSIESD